MTELKTLKDLDTKLIYNGIDTPHPYNVVENFKIILKSEAIKWVKKAKDKLDEVKKLDLEDVYHCEVAYGNGMLHAFRDFFNLTSQEIENA
jgi:hypothetical protein